MKRMLATDYMNATDKDALVKRLNRAGGQIAGVRKMIENGACVDELLVQLSAAKAALTEVSMALVEGHLVNCVQTCMSTGRTDIVRRVTKAFSAVIRNG